jgi:hypothetical protein
MARPYHHNGLVVRHDSVCLRRDGRADSAVPLLFRIPKKFPKNCIYYSVSSLHTVRGTGHFRLLIVMASPSWPQPL